MSLYYDCACGRGDNQNKIFHADGDDYPYTNQSCLGYALGKLRGQSWDLVLAGHACLSRISLTR